jgi:hypothetical protein
MTRARRGVGRPAEADEPRDIHRPVRLTKGEAEALDAAGIDIKILVRTFARTLMGVKKKSNGGWPKAS